MKITQQKLTYLISFLFLLNLVILPSYLLLPKKASPEFYLYFQQQNWLQAFTSAPDDYHRAVVSYQAGDYDLARKFFAKGNNLKNKFNLANSYLRDHQAKAAKQLYQEILIDKPNHQQSLNNLAIAETMLGQANFSLDRLAIRQDLLFSEILEEKNLLEAKINFNQSQ